VLLPRFGVTSFAELFADDGGLWVIDLKQKLKQASHRLLGPWMFYLFATSITVRRMFPWFLSIHF
jgi:hypothetical protein